MGSRNAGRERKCSANCSDWPVPTRTGALIWRHLTDFYTHCAHSVDRSMADLSVADQSHDRDGRPRITRRWVPSSRCGFASTALWFRIQGVSVGAVGGCWVVVGSAVVVVRVKVGERVGEDGVSRLSGVGGCAV